MLVLALPAVVGTVAFSIDIGMMTLLRSQLQNAVDSGALAASLKLEQDATALEEAAEEARRYIRLNQVGSNSLVPEDAIDVEIGYWDDKTNTFTATSKNPNAVRVFARQDNEPYIFGRALGYKDFGAPASAIASGSGAPTDIMMVLDLSGSMKTGGRIEALWNSAPLFVDTIEELGGDHQIGVMGLSANPDDYDPQDEGHNGTLYNSGLHPTSKHHVGVLEATFTQNWNDLKSNVLSPSNLEAGKYTKQTGTGAAIGDAAHYLAYAPGARADAKRIMVLMSDGKANRPNGNPRDYARQMAAYAASHDVTIYTISLGNSADTKLMKEIAEITGGTHFEAKGSGGDLTGKLRDAFQKAALAISGTQLIK